MFGSRSATPSDNIDAHVGELFEAVHHKLRCLGIDYLALPDGGYPGIGVDEHVAVGGLAHLSGQINHDLDAVAAVGADDVGPRLFQGHLERQ